MTSGSAYEVQVSSTNFNIILGYQNTTSVARTEILDVIPSDITTIDNFGMRTLQMVSSQHLGTTQMEGCSGQKEHRLKYFW